MSSPDDVQKRLELLERRMTDAENRLRALGAPPAASPEPASPIASTSTGKAVDRSPDFLAQSLGELPAATTPRPRPAPASDTGSTISRVMGVLAALCFVVGAGFLIKLSVDNGWLTPWRQLLLAAALGTALVAAGLKLRKRDAGYAIFLPVAGVAILYASALLGFFVHGLFSPVVCLVLTNAVSLLALVLPKLFSKDPAGPMLYGLLAVFGAYGGSFALAREAPEPALLAGIFFAWAAAFSVLSVVVGSRVVGVVASYLGIGLFHFWMQVHRGTPNSLALEAALQLVQFLVFAAGVYVFGRVHRRVLAGPEAWAYFPSLLFFYAIEWEAVHALNPALATPMALLTAAVVFSVYAAARQRQGVSLASGPIVATYVAVVLVHAVYAECFREIHRQWAGPFLLLACALLSKRLPLFGRYVGVGLVLSGALLWSLASVLFPFENVPAWQAVAIHALTMLVAFAVARPLPVSMRRGSLYFLAHIEWIALAVVFLGRLSRDGLFPEEIARYALSILWACYAASVLAVAKPLKNRQLALSSLLVLAVAVVKLFLFDVDGLAPMVRVLCFMAMGAILYGCGWVLRNVNRW